MTYPLRYIIILAFLLCACGLPTSSIDTPQPSAAPVPRGWMARILKDNDRLEASGVQWFYYAGSCNELKCRE